MRRSHRFVLLPPVAGGATPLALATLVAITGCDYVRLLRPSVLKQLDPPVVRLVNFLPEVDEPNKAMLARLFATGGLSEARIGADGGDPAEDG